MYFLFLSWINLRNCLQYSSSSHLWTNVQRWLRSVPAPGKLDVIQFLFSCFSRKGTGNLFDQHRHQRLPTRARGQRVPTQQQNLILLFFQFFVYWLVVESRSTGVGYLPALEQIFNSLGQFVCATALFLSSFSPFMPRMPLGLKIG